MPVKFRIPDNWIRDYLTPRHPELVAPYREAAQITQDAILHQRLADADLDILLAHAESNKSVLSGNVADMLGKLANLFPSVQRAIERMAREKQVMRRICALQAMLHLPPSELHERIYAAGLLDRSKKVRMVSAKQLQQQGLATMIPLLEHAVEREADAATRDELECNLSLLRDGYRVQIDPDGHCWVTCRTDGGTTSRFFESDRFETDGKAWIERQARPGTTGEPSP